MGPRAQHMASMFVTFPPSPKKGRRLTGRAQDARLHSSHMNDVLRWTASIKGRFRWLKTVVRVRDTLNHSIRTSVTGHHFRRQVNLVSGGPKPDVVAKALPLLNFLGAKASKLVDLLETLCNR